MNFVLDTNAISETRKPRPNPGLMAWRDAQDPAHLFLTTITLAEVWSGFHSLQPEHRDYDSVKQFATDLPRRYRILNFDARAAAIWGEMNAQATGPLPLRDSFIHCRHCPFARLSYCHPRRRAVRALGLQGHQPVEIA